jgi:hypothetical protein
MTPELMTRVVHLLGEGKAIVDYLYQHQKEISDEMKEYMNNWLNEVVLLTDTINDQEQD